MSLEDVVYSKINSKGLILRIKTVWNCDSLQVTLLENLNVWSSLVKIFVSFYNELSDVFVVEQGRT